MTEPDYATWYTKTAAAERLAVSTKTVEQLTKDGQLQSAVWRRPTGGMPLRVYHPDDVDRIATARHPGLPPFVVPAGAGMPGNGNGHLAQPSTKTVLARTDNVPPTGEEILRLVFAAALRALTSDSSDSSESSQSRLFLTIPEAAAMSGLSKAYLKRSCQDGTVPAVRDGRRWRIRRKDLACL